MTPPRTTCPFCNSAVPVPEPAPARLECPRCGERFPYHAGEGTPPAAGAETPPPRDEDRGPRAESRKQPLEQSPILRAVLLGAVVLAAGFSAGLAYYWWSRPKPGPAAPGEPGLADVPASAAEWPGLAYVLGDANAILAARPGVLRQRTDPALVEQWVGRIPGGIFAGLRDFLGRDPLSLDEVLLAARVGERFPFPVTLVLIDRRGFAPDELEARAKPSRHNGRTYYRVELPGSPLPVIFWRPRPDVLVGALSAETLSGLPAARPAGTGHLSETLRELITTRLPEKPLAWAAAETDGWEKSLVAGVIAGRLAPGLAPEDLLANLRRLSAVSVALSPGEPGPNALTAWVRLDDAEDAARLREWLAAHPAPEGGAALAAGGAGEWAFARAAGAAEEIRRTLASLTPPRP